MQEKIIIRFEYSLNGKLKNRISETFSKEGELLERYRSVYEYNKEGKLISESCTLPNNHIRIDEYFYDEKGLLEKIEQEDLQDKNKHILYEYNYTKNSMLESIIIKYDTSVLYITHKEDGNKVILTDYEVDDDQKVKSYSSFYIKNSDDQFIEYKKNRRKIWANK